MVHVTDAEHVALLEFLNGDEVGPLEVLDPRMIGREAAGRALEAVALQGEPLAELAVVAGPAPAVGPLDDRLADLVEGLGFRPPEAHGQEALARRDVDIEARGMDVAALLVAELDADVGLVARRP